MTQLKRSGYTLIEILVVISIIAILTAIGITNFRVASQKARDGKRQGDLEQIKAALELYRTDEKEYPLSVTQGTALTGTNTYMEKVPSDPIPTNRYSYYTPDSGATYNLCAALELGSGSVSDCGGGCGGATCNYKVSSPL